MLSCLSILLAFTVALVAGADGVSTNATCSSAFAWSFNSLGQTPCLVAAYLGSTCNNGLFMVPALTSQNNGYIGPTVSQAAASEQCACSSVFYSLLSACADCQSGLVIPWDTFKTNCSQVFEAVFAKSIPTGTSVPHWAYQNFPSGGSFNATLAQLQLNAPESTSTPTATSAPPAASSHPSSKKSKAGPIAGGVVGGIAALVLLGIAVFWFLRQRRRGGTLVPGSVSIRSTGTGEITPYTSANPTPKLYNPADPSTFPSSPSTRMYAGSRVHSPSASGGTMTELSMHRTTQYSGAPEV
ncbi:hypothetical protein MIND_01016600 [Mycena indigotica]|uniref:Uncharacterized protein n=1 Tax=Mycena indigotica TaxID=2126181 RepID=A0A8H6W0D8_9AGAR|nr:uncharacterized protein MIND_01016600 [Mycena indigotica]KAF7294789.1 hypothetical protein MIND_01016600 [Mycena indigotica]